MINIKETKEMGRLINFHRKQAKLTQFELSKLAGVGKAAVFDIEHGKETFQIDTLLKLLNVLNIQIRFSSPLMSLFEKQKDKIS